MLLLLKSGDLEAVPVLEENQRGGDGGGAAPCHGADGASASGDLAHAGLLRSRENK